MGLTQFPNGVSSFGMPQLGSAGHFTTGNVYFVDSGAAIASDGNLGTAPDKPLATLNGAMDKCTASNGDMVFLMPGHTEDLDAATDAVVDVAGVRIIGVGVGSSRPTFTYSGTAGSFELDAADTYIENVVFKSSVSAVVVGVNVDANNVHIHNCEWNFDATGDDFITMVDVDDVDHCSITHCRFIAEAATAGAAEAIRIDTADWFQCIGNLITGDYSDAAIVGEGAASTQIYIADNAIYNDDTASSQNGIDLNVACTGVIAYNRLTGLQATGVANLLDPGSCLNIENYGCNAIDELGIVIGGTAST